MAKRDSVMTKPKDTRGAFRRLLSYLGAFRLPILGVAVLCVLSNVLSLWGPSLAGSAINEAAAESGEDEEDEAADAEETEESGDDASGFDEPEEGAFTISGVDVKNVNGKIMLPGYLLSYFEQ